MNVVEFCFERTEIYVENKGCRWMEMNREDDVNAESHYFELGN